MKFSQDQDFKKKRQQFTVNLRKTQRQEMLMKKRNIQQVNNSNQKYSKKQIIVDQSMRTYLTQVFKQKFQAQQIAQLVNLLSSTDIFKLHRAVIGIRKIASKNAQFLSDLLLKENLVELLIRVYNQNDYPQIKLEMLWAFTNLTTASNQFTTKLMELKIASLVAQDMINPCQQIQYHAIWTAGNIAADNTKYRDQLLIFGTIYRIIKFLEKKRSSSQVITAVWSLTNLARGNPPPKYDTVKYVVAPIAEALKSNIMKSQQILSGCLWTLANLSEGGKVHVQRLAETQIIQKVMQYALHPQLIVCLPAIRIIGNFTNGTKQHTNLVLKYNFFDIALNLLENSKNIIVKQICWAISNITAGTDEQMLHFLQREDLIKKLLQIYPSRPAEVKTQIIWIFTNLEHCQLGDMILNLYEAIGIIRMIGDQLSQTSERSVLDALSCLYKIFVLAARENEQGEGNKLVHSFCKLGYAPILQSLQKHQSSKVYNQCNKILERFFSVNETTMTDL